MSFATFVELFAWPLVCLGLAALCAPLTGAFLCVRGATFQGVVLPQMAALGVSLGFLLFPALPHEGAGIEGHVHGSDEVPRGYLLLCAAFAVAAGQVVLGARAAAPGGDRVAASSREAGLFVVASGGTVIASQLAPLGGLHVGTLLSGETLATGPADALLLGLLLACTAAALTASWRRITVAGHDPEFAAVSGQGPERADLTLAALTAGAVIVGALTVGVLALFALMVLPGLAAARRARSMGGLLLLAPLLGLAGAILGAFLSFGADLPMGASVVAGSGLVWCGSAVLPRG